MAYNYGPQALDFTPLASLGETFFRARDQAVKRRQEEEAPGLVDEYFKALSGAPSQPQPQGRTLAELGQGLPQPPSYNAEGKAPTFTGQPVQTASILKQFEGYRDKPYWDVNAYRIGYGSDTITDPNTGEVRPVRQGDRIDRAFADADLARRIPEFQATAERQTPNFRALPENVQSALTSVAYNYGSLPRSVVAAVNSGDVNAIAKAVESLPANPDRRRQEAAIIRGGGAPAADMPAQGAQPAQGFLIPGQTEAGGQQLNGDLLRRMYANPNTRPLATAILSERLKGRDVKTVDLGGSIGVMDNQGNILRQIPKQAAEKWQRLSDGALFNPATGETRAVDGQDATMFRGNSVDAQALNELVLTGQLTREQAAQFAAGKTVTGPNGEQLFLTPQGVFSSPAPNAAPAAGTATAANAPAPRDGVIQLTSPKPEKPTDGQSTTSIFAERAMKSNEILARVDTAGMNLPDAIGGRVPFGVDAYLTSPQFKSYDQAKRDFINAVLRKESGAVISPEEFANADKQYFPRPGDDPATIEQKRQNRQTVVEGLARASGPAMPKNEGGWTDVGGGIKIRKKQ